MKKLTSVLLVLIMVLAMSVSAFAATYDSRVDAVLPWTDQGTVQVIVKDNTKADVYYVEVTWDDLQFTYNIGSAGQWDPEDHVYEGAVEEGWDNDEHSGTVTVKNHSNQAIKAEAALHNSDKNVKSVTDTYGFVTALTGEDGTVAACLEHATDAPFKVFTYTVTAPGDIPDAGTYDVATVTVFISKV